MKISYKILGLIIFMMLPFMMKAQYSCKYQLTNFMQVNETYVQFDLVVVNTGTLPFGINSVYTKIIFNPLIYSGQAVVSQAKTRAATPLSSDLVGWYGTTGGNPPTLSQKITTAFNTDVNNLVTGYIVVSTGSVPQDNIIDLLNVGASIKVATIKLLFTTGTTVAAKNRPFEDLLHGISFDPTAGFHTTNRVDTYDDVIAAPDVYKIGTGFTAVPTTTENLIPNTRLAKYCLTSGEFSTASALWNAATSTGITPKGTVPASTNCAMILGAATLNANQTLVDLTLKSAASLQVNAGKQLTVTGTLTKENVAVTALTLKSDLNGTASLLNSTSGITATIERYIPAWTTNEGYHLLSSPVSGQLIAPNFVTTPATNYDFYLYNPAAAPNVWVNYKGSNFTAANGGTLAFVTGKGYLASYFALGTHNFVGAMNVANVSPTLAPAAGFNLVGNPYACAIQGTMSTFSPIGMNANVWVLDGTTNSYKAWNGTTGTLGFTGQIPAMQGFFVQATAAGASMTIPASAKMHSSSNFYKTTLDNHLELKVQSPNNTIDATVIYFKDENSNDVDCFDAMLMPTANPLNTQIYSYINSDKYCIDALAAYSGPYTVNVGFEPKVDGNFTITASDVQSFNTNSTITLVDLQTGATQNLRSNPTYTFAATTTQDVNRFKLVFDLALGINNANAVANAVYSFDNSIYIKTTEKVKSVSVFNMLGQEVENIQQPTSNVLTLHQATGYYTVRVITEANVYSQKVYIK